MIGKDHFVESESWLQGTVEFDRDAWCRDAAAALARRIDEVILECLTSTDTTSGTSASSPSPKALKAGDVIRATESLQLLSTPLQSTFDASESKLRLECMYGLTVRPSDRASAVLPLPCA